MTVRQKKGLGTELKAILSASGGNLSNHRELRTVMVQNLFPGRYQPRRSFNKEALQELSDSIASKGILQPIIAREVGDKLEIIAGERRWRAAQMAGLKKVPVVVSNISDESALAFGLIENIQRQDLNPIEEAVALKRLIEEFNMTHEQVAESIGRSRTMVTNTLRLLKLAPPVQQMLADGKLDAGHAKALAALPKEDQIFLSKEIADRGLSVRETEALVKKRRVPQKKKEEFFSEEKKEIEHSLSTVFEKASVSINSLGRGKITIHFSSLEELEPLVEFLHSEVR